MKIGPAGDGSAGDPVPGGDLEGLYYVKNIRRAMEWDKVIDTVKTAVIVNATPQALEMVTEARDRGLPAYAETCPQYLFLSYDNYEEPGFDGAKYVMSPPLRAKDTQDRLWRGLAFNDLQAISTDHCPF